MKVLSIAMMALVSLGAKLPAQDFKTVDLVTDDWVPYVGKDLPGYGLTAQIVDQVFKGMGCQPRYSFVPYYLGYQLVREGKITGTFPWFKNETRVEEMVFSDSLLDIDNVFFFRRDKIADPAAIRSFQDLTQYKIGVVQGYSYGQDVDPYFREAVQCRSETQAFEKLQNGDFQLLPASEQVGREIIKNRFYVEQAEFEILPHLRYKETLHFVVGRSLPEAAVFMKSFNQSLKRIKAEGVYRRLIEEHELAYNRKKLVRLQAVDSFPMVVGFERADDKNGYLLPRGTLALVLQWSDRFLTKGSVKMYDQMFVKSKVRILDGPLKGRILYVDNIYIEFE